MNTGDKVQALYILELTGTKKKWWAIKKVSNWKGVVFCALAFLTFKVAAEQLVVLITRGHW